MITAFGENVHEYEFAEGLYFYLRRAIEGARVTISGDRPVMKIACYHRSEDVFAIVKKVLEIRDDYKVYMRHTRCIPGWDTDFYFV